MELELMGIIPDWWHLNVISRSLRWTKLGDNHSEYCFQSGYNIIEINIGLEKDQAVQCSLTTNQ